MITAILYDDRYHFAQSSKNLILNIAHMTSGTMLS